MARATVKSMEDAPRRSTYSREQIRPNDSAECVCASGQGHSMKVVSSQWSVVSKSVFYFALCAGLFVISYSASAPQPGKIARVGYLTPPLLPENYRVSMLFARAARARPRRGKEHQHRNASYRWKSRPTSQLAAEFVRAKVDVLVVASTPAGLAAKMRPRP